VLPPTIATEFEVKEVQKYGKSKSRKFTAVIFFFFDSKKLI